jgi:hypothetical protein
MQIKSNNPNFSFIIRKNPSSGMIIEAVRKGYLFGWYTGENTYNLYFKDSPNEI